MSSITIPEQDPLIQTRCTKISRLWLPDNFDKILKRLPFETAFLKRLDLNDWLLFYKLLTHQRLPNFNLYEINPRPPNYMAIQCPLLKSLGKEWCHNINDLLHC